MRTAGRTQKGVVTVELALLMPVYAVLMFGIAQFGLAFYQQQVLASVAREAARYGIVATLPRPSATDIENVTLLQLREAGLDTGRATVEVLGAGGESGEPVTVTVQYVADLSIVRAALERLHPGGSGLEETITLESRARMLLE